MVLFKLDPLHPQLIMENMKLDFSSLIFQRNIGCFFFLKRSSVYLPGLILQDFFINSLSPHSSVDNKALIITFWA